jgi:hypothetical protein
MINISFLTKEDMAKTGKKTNEQKELDAIMTKNGYKKGYCGSRIMKDDIILDEEYPSA